MKLDIKILYLSFHNSLKKVWGVNHIIPRKIVFSKLGKQYLVPKGLRGVALKELEDMKLLERVNRDQIKILEYELDLEKDSSKFFEMVGLLNDNTKIS